MTVSYQQCNRFNSLCMIDHFNSNTLIAVDCFNSCQQLAHFVSLFVNVEDHY